MTIEHSHGKPRLTKPRVRATRDRASADQPRTRAEQRQENARYRGSKEATRAPLAALVDKAVRKAVPSDEPPEASRLVAENALQLAGDLARSVNVAHPLVAHHCTRFGVNAALAGFYTQRAAELGFDSERGLELVDAAHKCEGRAERAQVALDAAVKAFAGKRKPIDVHARAADVFGGGT